MRQFTSSLLIILVVILGACQASAPASGASTATPPPASATHLAATPAPAATTMPSVAWGTFQTRACEWSNNVGGRCYETRGEQFAVELVRCEGPRVLVHDPTTDGPAYVDRAVLTLPTDFCIQPKLASSNSKSVVVIIGGPASYANTSTALAAVARLLSPGVQPGDRTHFVFLRPDGADIVPPVTVAPLPSFQLPPSPTPCRNPVDRFCWATATAIPRDAQAAAAATPQAERDRLRRLAEALQQAHSGWASTDQSFLPALNRARQVLDEGTGSRWLLIASRLEAPDPDAVRLLPLPGLQLRFVASECVDARHCADWEKQWEDWGVGTNVDVGFWDASVDLAEKVR